MDAKKKVLCIADAPGPAEFLAPVIPLLEDNADVHVIAVDKAMNILRSFDAIECNDETQVDELYQTINPDLLVSAISSLTNGPYINNKLIEAAYRNDTSVICLQDYWGNHRWPQNKELLSRLKAVCVLDEFAASLWKEDGFTGKIVVTGNPAFDTFALIDVAKERMRLRTRLHFNDSDFVIIFAGQGTPHHINEDKATFQYVAEAIRALPKDISVKLIVREHPRAVETNYYKELTEDIEVINTSFATFSDEVLPVADAVVSMFSTNLIHACLLRIPAISVLLPEQGRALLRNIGLTDFPLNRMGATVAVYEEDPAVLCHTLEKVFNDKQFRNQMRTVQEKNFPLNRGAAERVVEVVKKML